MVEHDDRVERARGHSPARASGPDGGADRAYLHYWDEMPCYLSIHDRDFRIVDGNRRFREDFGEMIGELCYRAYKQREEVCPDCPVEATFTNGCSQPSEQLLITRHGDEMPVMVHTTPIRNASGAIELVMEMHTDIRELKRVEALLRGSRERLAQLFEEVPCYITVQRAGGIIEHANRAFRDTFGPAVGRPCHEVYKQRDEQCLVCPMRQTLVDGKTREHEEVLVTADGRKLNALCTTAPLRNAAGEIEAVIEMSVDITQLRELQSQLTSVGLLVGSISHGIKGLLTGLDGGIYLVTSGFAKENPERVKKGWAMVQRNVERIRSMVLDILYYAKDRELSPTEIDVAELVEDLREGVAKKASDLDVELDIDVPPESGTFAGDRQAIRAMLVNLLENSLEACRSDDRQPRHALRLSARRSPPWMVLEVADDGIGMDRETRERVFSLFFSSKGIKGTGLGLFIANKIVAKHGGTIAVESEPGAGSRFTVRIPLEARPSTLPGEAE